MAYDPRFSVHLEKFDKRRRKKLKWKPDTGECMQFATGEFVAIERGILYHIKPDEYQVIMGIGNKGEGVYYKGKVYGFGTSSGLETGIALAKHGLQMFADTIDNAVKAAKKGK